MKKLFLFCLLGFLGFAVFDSYTPIYAYPYEVPSLSVGDEIKFGNGPGTIGGGEFYVYDPSDLINPLYASFCLEKNEYLNYWDTFKINNISDKAFNGGMGGPSPDPISEETAYLFHHFFWGTLGSYYDYTDYAEHVARANALQTAIWYFEDELGDKGSFYSSLDEFDLTKVFIDEADEAVAAGCTNCADVAVMNIEYASDLYGHYGELAQSQLTVVPVPEPSTILLLGFGLIGLGGIGRTRFRLRGKRV